MITLRYYCQWCDESKIYEGINSVEAGILREKHDETHSEEKARRQAEEMRDLERNILTD